MTSLSLAAGLSWRDRLLALFAWLDRFPTSVFPFLFRLCVGGVFWDSGLAKIQSWQITLVLFRDEYRVPLLPPEIAAVMATAVELTAPVLLLVGFATRLTTVPLLAMILVIQVFVYPESWTVHLMWASMLLFLLVRGPGALSLDWLIARRYLGGSIGSSRRA